VPAAAVGHLTSTAATIASTIASTTAAMRMKHQAAAVLASTAGAIDSRGSPLVRQQQDGGSSTRTGAPSSPSIPGIVDK